MSKMFKKIIALVLAFTMIVGGFPNGLTITNAVEPFTLLIGGITAGYQYKRGDRNGSLKFYDSGINSFDTSAYVDKIYKNGVELEDEYILKRGETYVLECKAGDTDTMSFTEFKCGEGSNFTWTDNSLTLTDGSLEIGKYTYDSISTFEYWFKVEVTIPPVATITFDKNNANATGTMSNYNLLDEEYTLPVCTFSETVSPSAKIFVGWSFENDGEIIDKDVIGPDDYSSYLNNNAFTLYAQWDTFKIIEEPSESNDYTLKTNIPKLFGGFKSANWMFPNVNVSYTWYKVVLHDEIPLNVNKETNVVVGDIYGQPAVYTDADDKYYLIPTDTDSNNWGNQKPYTDFADGIDAFISSDETKYSVHLIIKTDVMSTNDKIKVTFDNLDPSMLMEYNGSIDTNPYTGNLSYGLTQTKSIPVEYTSILSDNPFKITGVSIILQDIKLADQKTSKLDRTKLNEEGTYYCVAQFDDYGQGCLSLTSQQIDVEPDIPAPTSGGSKTYKAKDTNKTTEKISGSSKKGSKRTITPIEGKKVGKVTVTDKDGNKVEVTPNADGTYSFIQPASDVNVEVTYVNREITLNIGSTEASVDGEKSNLDVCPVIRNDRTMLPIRFIAENLGAKVEWNEKNPDYVSIVRGDIKIEITLGSDVMKVNGKEVKLDSVAFAENDRTYLPVRAISENLNAIVEWNEARPMEVKIYER